MPPLTIFCFGAAFGVLTGAYCGRSDMLRSLGMTWKDFRGMAGPVTGGHQAASGGGREAEKVRELAAYPKR